MFPLQNTLRNLVIAIYGIKPTQKNTKTKDSSEPVKPTNAKQPSGGDTDGLKHDACPAKDDDARPTEWLADTGCGYDLISKAHIPKRSKKRIFNGEAITLHTANGPVQVKQKVKFKIPSGVEIEPYIMDDTPPVMSIGHRCMNLGWSFYWRKGRSPYFKDPNGKRYKLKVFGNVP